MNDFDVIVKVMKLTDDAHIPTYAHEGDSGVDLYSIDNVIVNPHETALIHTGIAITIPQGYEGCVRPRSGLALKQSITVLNSPGTIDSNYRGEVCVIIHNASSHKYMDIHAGDRIAQMVIQKVPRVNFVEVGSLDSTDRGTDGFGSTGLH